jgi:adenine-specific DNA-methyltransferase
MTKDRSFKPMEGTSSNLTAENISQLKTLFPEVVTEGKIDFDVLKTILGEEVDESEEKYKFTWHGKLASMQTAQQPTMKTLLPHKQSSLDWENTGNIYIEGDNLEALKIIQKSYAHKVKVIYIDPPYNTGKDFVYHDDFSTDTDSYLAETNQTDSLGSHYATNTESNGKFHTDWLNMMYSRLKLAQTFLRDDGVIFVSIDDSEQANLKKMMDEIFGEQNFLAQVIWERAYSPVNLKKNFSLNCQIKRNTF